MGTTIDQVLKASFDQQQQTFDYAALDTETRSAVQHCTFEIKQCLHDTVPAIWETGQQLAQIRQRLEQCLFLRWLKAEFGWSDVTAHNYMNVYESFEFTTLVGSDITIEALYILAADSTPLPARTEAIQRARAGEKITYARTLTIIRQHDTAASKTEKTGRVTIDVTAETVETQPDLLNRYPSCGFRVSNVSVTTVISDTQLRRELSQRAKQLGLLPSISQVFLSDRLATKLASPTSSNTREICNQFIEHQDEMDRQCVITALKALLQRIAPEVLDSMCNLESKTNINHLPFLGKTAVVPVSAANTVTGAELAEHQGISCFNDAALFTPSFR